MPRWWHIMSLLHANSRMVENVKIILRHHIWHLLYLLVGMFTGGGLICSRVSSGENHYHNYVCRECKNVLLWYCMLKYLLHSFKMFGYVKLPVTQHNIPLDKNSQRLHCGIFKLQVMQSLHQFLKQWTFCSNYH